MSTTVRPYDLTHTDGRRLVVVAKSQAEAISHAERGWTDKPASALYVAQVADQVQYARAEYQPLPAGTPTADDLRMPGEQS